METSTLFAPARLSALKQALNVYAQRHRVVAENIANVETPGYAAQEYRFEEYLARADGRLAGTRTHPAHLPVGKRELTDVQGQRCRQGSGFDNGTNDVNIDQEMAGLVTTDLAYRLATRLLSMKYRLLHGAITGRIR
jgi:flagellar basal-body rod protein FlgB